MSEQQPPKIEFPCADYPLKVIGEMSARLTEELIASGADADTIRIADIEETAVSYMADESTRIRVKMIGDLSFGDGGQG